jgi:recombination protein RecT
MNTNTQAVTKTDKQAVVPKSVKGWLTSDFFRQQVALVLPRHVTPERFVRVAISALGRVPKLAQCTPESVMKCMMTCSELGIEPDGRRAHLIPYKDQCTLILDYKGLVELAKRSGDVSSIFAQTVCDNDFFEYNTGEVTHKIDFKKDRGTMYAVYCVVLFKDGGKHTEVMTKAEIDRIRQRSRASGNGPWVTDYDEMAKKTVFRRASKWVVLSPEIQDALDKEDDSKLPSLVSEVSSDMLTMPELGEGEPEPEKVIDLPPAGKSDEKPQPEKIVSQETVQDQLAKIVTDGGFTFEHFKRWAKDTGNVEDIDDRPGFAEIHTRVAERLIRAKAGLLKGLAEIKGAA